VHQAATSFDANAIQKIADAGAPVGVGQPAVEGAQQPVPFVDRTREFELSSRLGNMARTLGRDSRLRVEPGEWWAYHFEKNKITYPIKDMLNHGDGYNMGVICHELSHRLYSRIPADDRIQNKAFHYLWNAIEDVRINKIISERFAGVPRYMRELYQDFTSADPELEKAKNRPRSQQFALSHIYEWASGKTDSPFAVDPAVVDAIKESRKHVAEATQLPDFLDLRFGDVTADEASRLAHGSFDVIREKVWPIYERLLKQDIQDPAMKEQLKKQNEQASQEKPAPGAQKGQAGSKPDAGEKAEQSKKADTQKSEAKAKDDKAGKSEKAGKSDKGEEAGKAEGEADKAAKPEKAGKSDKGDEAGEAEGADGAEGKAGASKEAGKPGEGEGDGDGDGKAGKAQGAGKPGQKGGEAGEPGQAGEGKPGAPGESKAGRRGDTLQSGGKSEGLTEGTGEESWGRADDGTISTNEVPFDPLRQDAATPDLNETRRELEKLFERAAKDLESRIARSDESERPEVTQADAERRKGNLDSLGDTNYSLEDQMRALTEQLRLKSSSRVPSNEYAKLVQKNRKDIDLMVAEIGNALERDDLPQLRGHFRSGQFDLKRSLQSEFQRQATGRGDPKVFLRRDDPIERKTEFVFCVDISGSMKGQNITAAREAYVLFQEALSELGIANATIAYNGKAFVLTALDKQADAPARVEAFSKLVAGGDNNEPAALKLARDMFEGSNANNKVVLFLTDGGAVADAKSYVAKTEEETDLKVIGIGIGAGVGEVKTIFPKRHLVVPNVTELAKKIGEKLKDILVNNGG
jgi:uncharacterized protein with von Willebrand factor type A (vWA) domain